MKRHSFFGLTSIINDVTASEKPAILDLSIMMPSIFPFFPWRKCIMHSECLSERFQSNPEMTTEEVDAVIDEHFLKYKNIGQFDAILTWDLLNYMEISSIKKLVEKLKPHYKMNTLFHTIQYTGSRIPAMPCQFKIVDETSFYTYGQTFVNRKIASNTIFQLLNTMPQFIIKNEVKRESMQEHFTEHVLCFNPELSIRSNPTYS